MTSSDKHFWLFKTLYYSRGGLTLAEISDRWMEEMSYDRKPLNRTTFDRWKNAVQIQFDISIENEKRPPFRYYIVERDDIDQNKLYKWLLDSMSIGYALMDSKDIRHRIILENIPSAHANLAPIVQAMKLNHKVQITYRGFEKEHSSTFPINPLCIKLFNNRWYVVGESFFNDCWQRFTYGLDRIEEAVELTESFTYPDDFDPDSYFDRYIGVSRWVAPIDEPIRFRVYSPHKNYIATLPIHHSQRMIADEGEYADFEIDVAPSEEFFMAMLSGGSWIEVLSPKEVVNEMKGWVRDLYKVYFNE